MKTLLVSIAKNEGAYIPEWAAHHFCLGVDEIWIYGNGIQDNTEVVCNKISKHYPLKFLNIDDIRSDSWSHLDNNIDNKFLARNTLQSRAFSLAYRKATESGFTHVMYFDVDEFFVSRQFTTIRDYIQAVKYDLINIKWFNAFGKPVPFLQSIAHENYGGYSKKFKCIVKTGIRSIKFKSTHQFVLPRQYIRYIEGYGKVNGKYNAQLDYTKSKNVCVYHKKYRSLKEYVALLNRGDTIVNAVNGFKSNRDGWKSTENHSGSIFEVGENLVSKLNVFYESFIEECGISSDLVTAQDFIMEQYLISLRKLDDFKKLQSDINSIFRYTGLL